MIMDNKMYDRIKFVALLIIPIGTLIASLLNVWHMPYSQEITATTAALDVFFGALVKISADAYHKENPS